MAVNGNEPADRLAVLIRQIVRGASRHGSRLHAEHGVTPAQLNVLKQIAEDAPVSAGDLAQRVDVCRPTMTRLLDRLERPGLVRRARDDGDRRRVLIHLEPRGAELAREVRQPLNTVIAARLAQMSDSEASHMIDAVQKLVVLIGAEDLDTHPLDAAASTARP